MRGMMLALLVLCSIPQSAESRELPPRIVMMWQVTGKNYANDFNVLKRAGVNTVQSFALAGMDPGYVDGYLNAAQAAGVGVVAYIGGMVQGQGATCALSEAGAAFVKQAERRRFGAVDEPVNHKVTKDASVVCNRWKSLDPQHFVMMTSTYEAGRIRRVLDERHSTSGSASLCQSDVGPAQQRLVDLFRQNRTRNYRGSSRCAHSTRRAKCGARACRRGDSPASTSTSSSRTGSATTSDSTAGSSRPTSASRRSTG